MPERISILVDGSNMYHYVKGLGLSPKIKFDYKKFAAFLAHKRKVVSLKYYIGRVRADDTEKSQTLRASQQRLTAWLRECGWEIGYGHMLRNDGVFKEKGVDVQMAVDMLRGAYKDTYDTAVLVSSDNDLIPAIREVQSAGKKVEYVGFSNRPSLGIIRHADIRTLLKKEDIEEFQP